MARTGLTERTHVLLGKHPKHLNTPEPALRSALNVPIRGLRLIESIAPDLERRLRASHKGRSHARIPWFSWAWLADAAQEALHDFALAALQRRGVPFNQATPSLGPRGATCWVLQDASGSEGGGGGAIYLDPDGSDPRWSFDSFTPEETAAHSTYHTEPKPEPKTTTGLPSGTHILSKLDTSTMSHTSEDTDLLLHSLMSLSVTTGGILSNPRFKHTVVQEISSELDLFRQELEAEHVMDEP